MKPSSSIYTKTRSRWRLFLSAIVALATSAQAGNYTWNSAGTAFGTAGNWTPNATFTSADLFTFGNATYANSPTVSADQSIGELQFTANNTGGITFGGGTNTLTLSGISSVGIQIDSGSGAVNTGSAKFALGASQSWLNNSSSTLTINGTITNSGNTTAYTLTSNGSGNTALNGIISNGGTVGTTALTKSGEGTLTLSGANTYTGNTTVNSGTLKIAGSGSLGSTTIITVASGATIQNSATGDNKLGLGASSWLVSGTINSTGGGANTLSGNVTLNNGTLTGVSATSGYGTFYVNAARTITANGNNNTISAADIGMSAGNTLTLATPNATDSLSLSSAIGASASKGAMALNKTGNGTVTLSGTSLWTGTTTERRRAEHPERERAGLHGRRHLCVERRRPPAPGQHHGGGRGALPQRHRHQRRRRAAQHFRQQYLRR